MRREDPRPRPPVLVNEHEEGTLGAPGAKEGWILLSRKGGGEDGGGSRRGQDGDRMNRVSGRRGTRRGCEEGSLEGLGMSRGQRLRLALMGYWEEGCWCPRVSCGASCRVSSQWQCGIGRLRTAQSSGLQAAPPPPPRALHLQAVSPRANFCRAIVAAVLPNPRVSLLSLPYPVGFMMLNNFMVSQSLNRNQHRVFMRARNSPFDR